MFGGLKERIEEHVREELITKLATDGEATVPKIGKWKYDRERNEVTFVADNYLLNELAYRAFPTHKETRT